MTERYLITGGNGNLARQMAKELLQQNHAVILADINPPNGQDLPAGAEFAATDITHTEGVRSLFKEFQPTHVCHMASLLSGSSELNREVTWNVNATASLQLLELSLAHQVKCFFFPSTAVTYGSGLPNPLPEDFPQWPETLYGATKVAVERAGYYYYSKKGLNFRSVRLPFVISGLAPSGALTAYASHAFVKAARGEEVVFPVHPGSAVSTIYTKDVIHGILQFIEAADEGLTRRVYNLHSFSPSAEAIATAIKSRLPDFRFSFQPDPEVLHLIDRLPARVIDESARSDWGWNPHYDLEKTTEDFLRELMPL